MLDTQFEINAFFLDGTSDTMATREYFVVLMQNIFTAVENMLKVSYHFVKLIMSTFAQFVVSCNLVVKKLE